MKDLRVAVWGLGTHAIRKILPAMQACPGVMLRAVCSRNSEVVARTAGELRCIGWTDPARMLADPEVDAVYLSTPVALHAGQGRAVLTAGKHLWCEKPLAVTAEQSAALTELSRERGVTLGEGFMYLYHPQYLRLQHIVKTGAIGYIQSVACRFGIPPLDRPGFRNSPELGGGAFLDVGSYPVSAIASLFPEMDPDVVYATIVTAPGSSVDTDGHAVLRYKDGVTVTLEWRIRSAYRNEIDLWGSTGSVWTDRVFSKPADYVPRFRFRDLHGQEREEEGTADNHFVSMFDAFRCFVDDPAGAERERLLIMKRARLMDRIREQSLQEE